MSGCEEYEYEPGMLYDESQPGAIVAELERVLELKHRTLLLETASECTIMILCCEDNHIHLRYNPQEVSVAMLSLYTGVGYAIAMATDWATEVHMPVRRRDVDRALREIDHTMEQFNPGYAQALRKAAPLLLAIFQGQISDALVTPIPGAKPISKVFDHNLPLPMDATIALNQMRLLQHAFSVPTVMGSDLVTGNGTAPKDERPS